MKIDAKDAIKAAFWASAKVFAVGLILVPYFVGLQNQIHANAAMIDKNDAIQNERYSHIMDKLDLILDIVDKKKDRE